jgi:hypothetical protein
VNWAQTATYFYEPGVDNPISRTDSSGTVYYLSDLSGNVAALAKPDGTLWGRYGYSPFGEVLSTDPGMPQQPLRWARANSTTPGCITCGPGITIRRAVGS